MATPRKRKPLSLPALPEPGVEARLHAACVKAGTDCLDLSGEPNWMRKMIDAHHAAAKAAELGPMWARSKLVTELRRLMARP